MRRGAGLLAVGLVARAFLIWFGGTTLLSILLALGRPASLGDRVLQVGFGILLLAALAWFIWGGVTDIRTWLRARGGPPR